MVWGLVLLANTINCSVADDDFSDAERLFALQIRPLLTQKCMACHGADPDDLRGGFDLRTRESLLRGGESFEADVVRAKDPLHSILYRVVQRKEEGFAMPPKEADRLSPHEIGWIRIWIENGLVWPDTKRVSAIEAAYAQGEQVRTSGGLSEDWDSRRYESADLWSYRPLKFESPPDDVHPVDWFMNRQLQASKFPAATDARPGLLLRRLSYLLTGLPPDPDRLETFAEEFRRDPSTACEKLADHLMQTDQYGEHFARQWLDVSRYADSAGFANDYTRPNAWRYRDYVVRSFNNDKPYAQFVMEQIAGDELDPTDPDHLIAVGFLRMGPWEHTGMSVFRVTRQQWLDDVTDSVGQSFLGHPLQCARCHDHKFDPVPTRDFYRVQACFTTTQFASRETPFLTAENKSGFEASDAWTKAKIGSYETQRESLAAKVAAARKAENAEARVGDNGLRPGDEASLARMSKNIARHTWELDKTRPLAYSVYTGKTVKRNNVAGPLTLPNTPWGRGKPEPDTILEGGDPFSAGIPVKPGGLSAAESLSGMPELPFAEGTGPRRLSLARWITHPQNALAARVIVNRIWSWHFGRGLAANPNNLGSTGELPTHPELLDYLANWFQQNDGSIKKLNRLIVTSQAFRRASTLSEKRWLREPDTALRLYAVFPPRRLSAEELRDAMLSVSGELNPQVGGIPCRPDINTEVAFQPRQIMGGTASVYEPDRTPEQRNRRSLYAEKIRGLRDPFLEVFNQPSPDRSCELRERSTVTTQALTLFNSVEVHERALALASRLVQQESDTRLVLERLFQLAYSRTATEREIRLCTELWDKSTKEQAQFSFRLVEQPSEIQRTVMAEKTGKPYDFVEILPVYRNYVPDLQPGQVSPRIRGLSQVCLVILNSNEFCCID